MPRVKAFPPRFALPLAVASGIQRAKVTLLSHHGVETGRAAESHSRAFQLGQR